MKRERRVKRNREIVERTREKRRESGLPRMLGVAAAPPWHHWQELLWTAIGPFPPNTNRKKERQRKRSKQWVPFKYTILIRYIFPFEGIPTYSYSVNIWYCVEKENGSLSSSFASLSFSFEWKSIRDKSKQR
jgi:hypothetical protein